MSTETQQEPLPIRHVQTVEIRYNEERNDFRITVSAAVKAAGLGKGATFQFKPHEIEELGVIPALGAAADEDAPRDQNTRTVVGRTEGWLELALPRSVVDSLAESLGIEVDEGGNLSEQLPLVDIFAGDRMIALAPAEGFDLPIAALPEDPDRLVDDSQDHKQVRLEAVQTARPSVKINQEGTSRMVVLTATRALREAGLAPNEQPHSVSYHPEVADDLLGLIPAVGYERAADVHDPQYAVYEKGGTGNGTAYSVGLPPTVLDELGLSVDEIAELDRSERPEITVYAAEGMLGFKTPTVREVAIEHDRTSELTGVDGIGEAVAGRLRERGYQSAEDLFGITREELLEIEGLSSTRVDRALDDLSTRSGGG
jgi:hypothetical protein